MKPAGKKAKENSESEFVCESSKKLSAPSERSSARGESRFVNPTWPPLINKMTLMRHTLGHDCTTERDCVDTKRVRNRKAVPPPVFFTPSPSPVFLFFSLIWRRIHRSILMGDDGAKQAETTADQSGQ